MAADSLAALLAAMPGHVITPSDAAYDQSRRLYDLRFSPRPLAVAQCRTEADVAACLHAARTAGLDFRIRGGGHSFAGYSGCDGLIIDLSGLRDITMSDDGTQLIVQAGCPQGIVNQVLAETGKHVPTGDASDVSIGGYMQGGGFGGTSRTHGFNVDHVTAVKLMLADGRVVRASAAVNHDLWWAVRGGTGNNFGVLLEIEYALLPAVQTASITLGWSLAEDVRDAALDALVAWRRLMAAADPRLNSSAVMAHAETGTDTTPWLAIELVWVGTGEELEQAAEPLFGLRGAEIGFDLATISPAGDPPPFIRRSRLLQTPPSRADWAAIVALLQQSPNRQDMIFVRSHGGAMNEPGHEGSAFIHRDVDCNLFMDSYWQDDGQRDAAERFADDWSACVDRFASSRVYQNFPDPALPGFAASYWGAAYPALQAVKAKYDPDNLFRFPQSIEGRPDVPAWPPRVAAALAQGIVA